jgi:hypothetical protein
LFSLCSGGCFLSWLSCRISLWLISHSKNNYNWIYQEEFLESLFVN